MRIMGREWNGALLVALAFTAALVLASIATAFLAHGGFKSKKPVPAASLESMRERMKQNAQQAYYPYDLCAQVSEEERASWRAPAIAGVPEAQLLYGESCVMGGGEVKSLADVVFGPSQDSAWQEGFAWAEKAALQGYVPAQAFIGRCYLRGTGVAKDDKIAYKWLKTAADQGDDEASYLYGVCLVSGRGVEKDPAKGVALVSAAERHGNMIAKMTMAIYYMNGDGVPKDEALAFKRYKELGDAKCELAYFRLAECYEKGKGVDKDEKAAVEWYRKAVECGDDRAEAPLRRLKGN